MGAVTLNTFHPGKLFVQYKDCVTPTNPIIARKYTVTHSDVTGKLFLTIGKDFAWDQIDSQMRDEVLGEWLRNRNFFVYNVYVLVAEEKHDFITATRRDEIFRRELPLALKAIRYGDRYLFERFPCLNGATIIVNFLSIYPQYEKRENWGTFRHFS